jgi:glycosyltransferase involved in cell wall biosynthesis
MKVLLVDPSLFTAPYDAALSRGLENNGVTTLWGRRDVRRGEDADLPLSPDDVVFYRLTDGPRRRSGALWKAIKGIEHAAGLRLLERRAAQVDLVHFQWTPLPGLDHAAMRRIARHRPVVMTVHDTEPFNGAQVSALQRRGFERLFDAAHHLIVHTERARATLQARGVAQSRISVIRHGPLELRCPPRPARDKQQGRWRVVLFGRMQSYKGIDLLIEALALLVPAQRSALEVIVAGEPFMPIDPLRERAAQLGLSEPDFQLRPGRLGDQDMADLLASADAFVFPYRAIEASGVLFLVAGLRKWIIASDLGAFSDILGPNSQLGQLVPVGDSAALARALATSIGRTPGAGDDALAMVPDWTTIGAQTRKVYDTLLSGPVAR